MLRIIQAAALVAVGIFILLVGALFICRSLQQQKHETDNSASKANAENKVDDIPAPENAEEAIARYNGLLALFTAVLAVVALVQIGFLISGDKTTKGALAAANRSAKIAEDSLVKLHRAFVSMQSFRALSHVTTDGTNKVWWSLHITWANSGASPTRNLRIIAGRYLDSVDMPKAFSLRGPAPTGPTSFIGPSGTIGSSEITVTGDELAEVQSGKKFLYIWGQADYRDIFPNTPDHVTKFFFRIVGYRGDPTKPWDAAKNVVEILTDLQDRNNCADEECDQKTGT